MSGDVYKVGISLIMTGNTNQFMAGLSKQILGVHTHAHDLERTLNRIGRMRLAVGGGIAIAGGVTALKGIEKLVDKGNELVKVQQNMAAAGVSAADAQEALNKSWQMTAKYQNIGATEVMKLINDGRMIFGSQHDATHHVEDFVQMASFLRSFQGGKHGTNALGFLGEVNAAMKSSEIAGKISPQEASDHVRQLTAMKVAYGEGLKIQQYLTAQRAAGASMRNTSDEFRYGMFPALVQENGSSAGVMLMTAYNKVVAATGNRTKSLEHMAEIGLLNRNQLEYTPSGHIKGLKNADGIKGSRDAAMNFGDWVMNTLKPRVDAVAHGDHIKESQLIASMFPDRNAQKAIIEILQQFTKFSKDAKLMSEAYKSLDMKGYVEKSWEGQKQAFVTQWDNFLEALGSPLVGPATDMLRRLNTSLVGMGQWASRPELAGTIEGIGKGIAVLGVALTGGGAVAILAALGPAGWIAAGLVAATGAFIAFKEPLEAWVRSVTGLGAVFDGLDAKFNEAAKAFGDFIAKIIATITGGLTGSGAIINGGKPDGVLPDELPGLPIHKGSYNPVGGRVDVPNFGGGAGGGGTSAYDAIMRAEGTAGRDPYNVVLGNGRYGLPDKALTEMTLAEAYRFGRTVRARHGSSSAIGAFQIVGRTMKDAASALGLDMNTTKFTPEIQRQMAKWIARTQGLGAWEGFKSHPHERSRARGGEWGEPAARPTVTPPSKARELVAHHHHYLDGRKIAENTSRHQFEAANKPATAANFSDGSEMFPQMG